MRRALFLALLLLAPLFGEVIRWQGSYDLAHREALKERKPLLVLLTARRCEACMAALARMNGDAKLVRLVNERTVPVLLTAQRGDYPIELLYTLEFPTLFLLSGEELFLAPPMRGEPDLLRLRRLLEKETLHE